MHMKIEVTGKGSNRSIRLIGDSQAMFWLQAAAANAMNGQTGNEAHLADGGMVHIEPNEVAQIQARNTTAHLKANLAG